MDSEKKKKDKKQQMWTLTPHEGYPCISNQSQFFDATFYEKTAPTKSNSLWMYCGNEGASKDVNLDSFFKAKR